MAPSVALALGDQANKGGPTSLLHGLFLIPGGPGPNNLYGRRPQQYLGSPEFIFGSSRGWRSGMGAKRPINRDRAGTVVQYMYLTRPRL